MFGKQEPSTISEKPSTVIEERKETPREEHVDKTVDRENTVQVSNSSDHQDDGIIIVNSIQIPHLLDPEKQKDVLDKENEETPEFTVRLGTSLTRKDADVRARALLKKLEVRSVSPYPTSSVSSVKESVPRSRRASTQRDRERSLRYMSRALGKMLRSRGRQSLGSISDSIGEKIPTEPTEKPYLKFRRIARTVRLLARILLALKSYVREPDRSEWSFMEMYLHVRDDLHKKVAFNPHSYVKVEPKRDRLKQLLSIPKGTRTLEEVKMTLSLMRDNTSFKDYPAHTQIHLAMCMEYQTYEARRVILRQGHTPSAFYIMLSGSAIVNTQHLNPSTGKRFFRTVHEIVSGDMFGEIALLESGRRTATVICKTPCELLVVQKEDFDTIIKVPLMREKVEHIHFCRELPLFQDFPCEVFADNTSGFFYQYFRKGDVIVKDSRDSKFIIVVAEGACQMISDVKETEADRTHGPMFAKHMEQAFPLYTEMRKIRVKARRQKTDDSNDTALGVRLLTGTLDTYKLAAATKTNLSRMGRRKSRHHLLTRSNTLGSIYDNVEKGRKKSVVEENTTPLWTDRVRGHTHPNGFRHSADVHRKTSQSDIPRTQARSATNTKSKFNEIQMIADSNIPPPSPPPINHPTEPRILHAQISELKPGSVFGLEALISRPSTTLSLVSDGAECIFISKRLFLKEANIKVLRIVTDLVHNHPCHDYIKEQVYTYRKWRKYKMDTVLDVVDRHRSMEVAIVGGTPDKKFPIPSEAYN
ncbi:uncharacterized protein LOC110464813 [Mizuhopecten yessoensis]|uniref:Cyclic nucleotide-binding domain-containing protein 2 n=1 Tax=Mizuhopecten yessoensis TaxID=6573 RepID=A0A210PT01_MIZYE|nr:uncharacterized protein LOC110464813 [Mizuhopecten yessoensis]OWF39611.1 Cyclic nucleotide-binding domain-containing protein 2 [Mizuhopecten yessoensis]